MSAAAKVVLALVLTAPFWDLGHPLWEVDDARYAEVPREMHESGDWTVPTLDYMVYIEKPPLIYWLGAASYAAFGVSEASARLPLALSALAGLAGAWWLGAWLFSPAVGAASALVLGTCLLFSGLSHLLTPDMAVSVSVLWATGLALRVLRRPQDARWAAPGAWLAMAAAFFSKGLIGLVLPGAWVLALAVLYPELRPGLRRLLLSWGLPAFCALVGLWLWRMESAVPGFLRVFFIEQHFQRFLDTGKYNRPGGWWYFLVTDLGGFLPWTAAAAAALVQPLARWRKADPRELQLALWSLLVLGFFTTSSSKLVTYLLPAIPHQAVLAARLLESGPPPAWLRRSSYALGALLAFAALGALVFAPGSAPGIGEREATLAAAALAALAAGTALAGRAALAGAGAAALSAVVLALYVARRVEPLLSARPVARELEARISASDVPARLVAYDRYLHGVPFYTGRPVDVVNWVGELHYAKRFERYAHRFGDDNEIRAWPRPGERVFAHLPVSELEWVTRTRGGPDTVRDVKTIGAYAVLELTARPAPPASSAGPGRAP